MTISRRLSAIKSIYDMLVEYFVNITEYMTKYSESDSLTWKNTHDEIPVMLAACQRLDSTQEKQLSTYDQLFSTMEKCDSLLSASIDILNKRTYDTYLTYNMSQTFVANNELTKRNITEVFSAYKTKIVGDEMRKLYEEIYSSEKFDIAAVSEFVSKIQFPNDFILFISSRAFSELSGNNARVFAEQMEKLKDSVLHITQLKLDESLPMVQHLTHRRGIFPITNYMRVDEVFKLLSIEYNFDLSIVANFSKLPVNVLVLHFESNKLIEYNISPLISEEYIVKNSLETNTITGINQRIIDRFSTIKQVEIQTVEKIPNVKPMEIHDNKKLQWMILHCVQFKHYRVMSNADELSNSKSYFVNADVVNSTRATLSARPHTYNKTIEQQILSRCINSDHRAVMLLFDGERTAPESMQSITENIVAALISKFELEYAANPPTNSQTMRMLFDNRAFSDIFAKQLLAILPDSNNETEINLSYIAKIDELLLKFQREYTINVSALFSLGKILDSNFNDLSAKHLELFVMGWFKQIIEKTITDINSGSISIDQFKVFPKKYVFTAMSRRTK